MNRIIKYGEDARSSVLKGVDFTKRVGKTAMKDSTLIDFINVFDKIYYDALVNWWSAIFLS